MGGLNILIIKWKVVEYCSNIFWSCNIIKDIKKYFQSVLRVFLEF